MPEQDRTEVIYMRFFTISVMVFSVFSIILLIAGNYAWWLAPESISPNYIRLSSPYRLSILIILPSILGFLGTGVLAGMTLFIDQKELWKNMIFWFSLGIFAFTIIAGGICLIMFSTISDSWSYGAGFTGTLVGASFIALISFLYFKIIQEYNGR